MSREELLADAIGSLDEEILLSVNRRRSAADSDANTGGLVLMKDGTEKKKEKFSQVLAAAVGSVGADSGACGCRCGDTDSRAQSHGK